MWVVSLELAGMNQSVLEAIDPDRAGWDAVVFDEAHRMTPTAGQWHRVGLTLARKTPRVVLMTATPHRGNEWLFRSADAPRRPLRLSGRRAGSTRTQPVEHFDQARSTFSEG